MTTKPVFKQEQNVQQSALKTAPEENPPRRRRGRPAKGDAAYRANLQVRVTQQTADECKTLGGAQFLRPLIEKVVKEEAKALTVRLAALKGRRIWRPSQDCPPLKFVDMRAACGFPSPAFDYAAEDLSLNDYFVKHQDATYIVQAQGDSMIDAGIRDGDILIIDRSVEPRSGDIVLAFLNGEFTLKRLRLVNNVPELHPENKAASYPVIAPGEFDDFQIEGVLVGSGRRYRT